eukprot:COSAG02_NODE_32178_length_520_cov_23.503563_1_plen_132_part_01
MDAGLTRHAGWLRVLLHAAMAAAAAATHEAGYSAFVEQRSYIESYEAPRIAASLSNYMREPGMLLDLSLPAFEMEVIREDSCATETDELREWLFTQAVAVSNRPEGSAITMLYAGMEDGRFIGCAHPPRPLR